ncbi:MAG: DUF721 domain-containing protein [Spartobacteria bacterium]|nr:DUF721 domain-containing protein [Spartobacteria bacterium]
MAHRRLPSFDIGRWQTQRERFHLSAERPPSPFVVHSPKEAIDKLMRGVSEQTPGRELIDDMAFSWEKIFGPEIGSHSRPGTFSDGTLTVYASHSIWVSELVRYSRTLLLSKLKTRFPQETIKRIRVVLDPDIPQ